MTLCILKRYPLLREKTRLIGLILFFSILLIFALLTFELKKSQDTRGHAATIDNSWTVEQNRSLKFYTVVQ